jgi:arginase family enzyme
MQKYPILQLWASEIRDHEAEAVHRILQHFTEHKVKKIYVSNDIDGTETEEGLRPEFIEALIGALKSEMQLVGGDVVEVAPPLTRGDFGSDPTCCLAAHYLRQLFPAAGNA